MKSLSLVITALLFTIASIPTANADGYTVDLDHKVHYELTKKGDKSYRLVVARLGDAGFSRMNLFATRKAKKICGGLGYSITYIGGVEEFYDRKRMPNYIFPSLKVDINCP